MPPNNNKNYILKFFRQSSHYMFGHILLMLSGFISFPILTRVFSRSDYGLLSLISISLWIALAFSKAGLQEAAIRFYNEFKTGKRKESITVFYTTLFIGSLFFALLIAALVAVAGYFLVPDSQSTDVRTLIWYVVIMIFSGSMFLRVTNFLRAEQRTKFLNFTLVSRHYVGLTLGILFIFLIAEKLQSYYSGIIIAELSIVFIMTLILIKNNKLKLNDFSITFLKECLIFGFPLIGFEMASFLIKSADRYIIQFMIGIEAVGIYSAGSNLCQYLKDGILFPVLYAVTPLYMQLWNEEGAEKTKQFISKITNYLILLVTPVTFGFIALSKQLIIILASAKFEKSASIIPFILPGAIFWGLSPLFAAGLYIHKKTKKLTQLVFIGVGINILLNILLIPFFHLIGAAIATLSTYFIIMIMLVKISNKYLKITIQFRLLAKSIFASVIMFLIIQYINIGTGIFSLLLEICVGAFVYIVILLTIDINIRKLILNIIIKKISFKAAN